MSVDKAAPDELGTPSNDLEYLLEKTRQHSYDNLSQAQHSIINTINSGFRDWHSAWHTAFFKDARGFRIVFNLMEALLHYEHQIAANPTLLSNDRTNAIAQAVARLIDCGNAILNMDLIVRNSDETSSEMDFSSTTTIELFKAHLKAQKLREKLLNDYFSGDKRLSSFNGTEESISIASLNIPTHYSTLPSPTMERSHKILLGSNHSINNLSDGKRTPISTSHIEVHKLNTLDLSNQLDITHMTATIRSEPFMTSSTTRIAFLPGILAKIEGLLTVPTHHEKLTRCFELLDALLDALERLSPEIRTKEVQNVAITLLKPLVRKVYVDDRENLIEYQHAHWIACLISLLRLMSPQDFSSFIGHFSNYADLGAFLKDFLFIIKRLLTTGERAKRSFQMTECLDEPMFSECWIDMTLVASSTFLSCLTNLYQILKQLFSSNLQMWSTFIECLICFNLFDALRYDRSLLRERQRLLANDIRQISADYVWIAWDYLNTNQKLRLMNDFIDPLLMACISMNSKQRSILLPIIYDMMHCDYTSQKNIPRKKEDVYSTSETLVNSEVYSTFNLQDDNLPPIVERSSSKSPNRNRLNEESLPYLNQPVNETVESEECFVLTKFTYIIVGKLNSLMFDQRLGDQSFKTDLCGAIAGELNPKYSKQGLFEEQDEINRFKNMTRFTVDLLAEFMQICLDFHQARYLMYTHLQLLCLFKLIQFFKDKIDRVDLYLNSLFNLSSLHYKAGRNIEAGLTLLEYAKTLPWSDQPISSDHRIFTKYFEVTENFHTLGGLKSLLYSIIIDYLDEGQIWEAAIPLCRELMDLYQYKTYEYDKLSMIFKRLADFFNNIIDSGIRSSPEYFRVSFLGSGFPSCLRGTTMVYRGKPFEKLGDFQATMLTLYPDATLLYSLAQPDESVLDDAGARYLQINACQPKVDLTSRFGNNLQKMDESALSYYKHNECDRFQFSRRISRPIMTISGQGAQVSSGDDNFADMWREKTTLTTNTLPGMLPFFPAYLVETSIVSPIECAIEDLERTNDRLSCMVNRFKADKRQVEDIRLLGQLLLGIVDAAVNGGIAKYEEAFFSPALPERCGSTRTKASSTQVDVAPKLISPDNYVSLNNDRDDVDFCLSKHANSNNVNVNLSDVKHLCKPTEIQVDKLKCLIARQVPLLDVAIRLHGDRVADIMRPQHEHLESSYRKLKQHIITKYFRYLPPDYSHSSFSSSMSGSLRSYRSLHRSPNRHMRPSFSPSIAGSPSNRPSGKRMSDVGFVRIDQPELSPSVADSDIPYQQLGRERRSLPFLSSLPRSTSRDVPSSMPSPTHNSKPDFNSSMMSSESFYQPALPPPRIAVNHTNTLEPWEYISPSHSEIAYSELIGQTDCSTDPSTARDDQPICSGDESDESSAKAELVPIDTEEVKLVHL